MWQAFFCFFILAGVETPNIGREHTNQAGYFFQNHQTAYDNTCNVALRSAKEPLGSAHTPTSMGRSEHVTTGQA